MTRKFRFITDVTSHHHEAPLVVPGPAQGGPAELRGEVIDRFIEAERAGAHTVLLATMPRDLNSDVAAICRYVVTDNDVVGEEAAARYGTERVLVVRSADQGRAAEWIDRLPRPEAHTLRRRIRRTVRRVPLAEKLYARIRSST